MLLENTTTWYVEARGNIIAVEDDYKAAREIGQQFADVYKCKVRLHRVRTIVDKESVVIYPRKKNNNI